MAPPSILQRRMLFVTGKGGVGKSTVAAALGLLAARSGRRTIVAEVAGQDRVARTLTGAAAPPGEHELDENLWAISIEPDDALRDYLSDQLPVRALAETVASSRTFGYLAAATPGLRELLTIGKAWDLVQPKRRTAGRGVYDLVIVDAPATGHGLAMLSSPRTFAQLAAVGPVARQGATLDEWLHDPANMALVVVALPEEMAVNEALDLCRRARESGLTPQALIANGVLAAGIDPEDRERLAAALAGSLSPGGRAAAAAALDDCDRVAEQRSQLARLAGAGDFKRLGFARSPELGRAEVEALAGELAEALA